MLVLSGLCNYFIDFSIALFGLLRLAVGFFPNVLCSHVAMSLDLRFARVRYVLVSCRRPHGEEQNSRP